MNQTQRSFLIKKIEETADIRIKALHDSKPELPSIQNWLLHSVLSDSYELNPPLEIKAAIKKKAISARQGRENWMNGSHWDAKGEISFNLEEIFIMPEQYEKEKGLILEERGRIQQEINLLSSQKETLVLRIQLASDKTLQSMINEVDNMGNLSLMDAKLKALTR